MEVVICSHASDRKFWGKLIITQTGRASKDMEFGMNSTNWRLIAPSDILFNKLIKKFCCLVNGL